LGLEQVADEGAIDQAFFSQDGVLEAEEGDTVDVAGIMRREV
jgi:hypothetical protein